MQVLLHPSGGRLCALCFVLFLYTPSFAAQFALNSSSQVIWGENLLGSSEPILAEYLKLNLGGADKIRLYGYGRASKNLGDGAIRDTAVNGRLYYLYVDYSGMERLGARMGRQYASYSAGGLLMDGLTLDAGKAFQHLGLAMSAGTDVQMTLDNDYSTDKRFVGAASLFLKNAGPYEADISYVRKFDDIYSVRELVGVNAAASFAWAKPYGRAAYNYLASSFDTIIAGLDLYPTSRLWVKGEYYQAYPTFDATSIYSVFAVDRYSEYMVRAVYYFTPALSGFMAYRHQMYEENDVADAGGVGGAWGTRDGFMLNASADYRYGQGGKLWGGELHGDWRATGTLSLAAGAQRDMYQRVETLDTWRNASRYWLGMRYRVRDHASIDLRAEENASERFANRFLGRATIDISF